MNDKPPSIPPTASYWVIPGRFRAGEYPGAATDNLARLKIRWLLKGGANLFIDLTEQGEAGLKPYDQILFEEAVEHPGVVLHKCIPLQDFCTPPVEKVVEILDTIDLALSSGKNIYLHCHGGKGRTGTVVGCFLVRQGFASKDAIEKVKELRGDVPDHDRQSPETDGQRRMVLEWKKGQ